MTSILARARRSASYAAMRDYHGLTVWQRAHALAIAVRRACRHLRRIDSASLRTQLIRAAESVPTNIVEGCYASSQREFARFLDISIKSSGELEYLLQLAHESMLLSDRAWQSMSSDVVHVRRMLVGLRRRVLGAANLLH